MPTAAVIRPGETEFDEQRRVIGTLDLPLTERGLEQVREIVDRLRELPVKQILTGPQNPAKRTAELVGKALGIPVKELDDLGNVDHGLWQGLCVDEIKHKHPKVFKQWVESPETVCPPGGETCHEAFDRVRQALKKSIKRKDNFAVVSCEPLASLIECVLRYEAAKLPSLRNRSRQSPVEFVEFVEFAKPETVAVAD